MSARNLCNLRGLDRIDERERLVEGSVRLTIQFHCGRTVHPCGDALERQDQLAFQLALRRRDLLLRRATLDDLGQLSPDCLEGSAGRLGRRCDVHTVNADVGVEVLIREHGVREPELLAYTLKEARAHAATEEHAEDEHRVSGRITVRYGRGSEDD